MTLALGIGAWALVVGAGIPLAAFSAELLAGLTPSRRRNSEADPACTIILVPAHNEEGGIAAMLADLKGVAPLGTRIMVIADNCTDRTAKIARAAGVLTVERHEPAYRGKGYALAHGQAAIAALALPPEVVIVLDADCRLSPGSVEALSGAARTLQVPVQAINLIDANLAAPPMVQISGFAMVVKNLFRSRGMQRLGGAALLTGTGMALPWKLFANADVATGSLVEDLALGLEMTRSGHPPRLVENAMVTSAPASLSDALQQRSRWEHGFLGTLRTKAIPVLFDGLRRGSLAQVLLGVHLMVPPLALLLLAALLALAICLGLGAIGAGFAPAFALSAMLTIALALVVMAWLVGGKEHLSGGALLRAPLYVLWKIPIYLKFFRSPETEWKRTPRP